VTSVTGRPDKVVDAPAGVTIVTQQAVATRPSLTVVDHIKSVPGLDVSTGGIVQSNVVSRGFNNAFSGTLLTLQDYRFATVPSLRVNVPFLFTNINEDIERVEVVLGPAAALYGPNSSSGVMHIVTRSPFESQGTTVTGRYRPLREFRGGQMTRWPEPCERMSRCCTWRAIRPRSP